MGVKHKDQRVAVLVDIQNMYYSAKQLYHQKVNFTNILKTAVAGRQLVRALAYVINADMQGEEGFHQALEHIGFEVKAKDLQIFLGGAKKGDWDVGIAMDALRLAPKVDVIVLVTGDGDFVDLVRYLQGAFGCRVEAMSFKKTCSQKLVDETDELITIDEAKYLIKDTRGESHERKRVNK
ncbi:MAG: NYN domain-containing protein [Nanoarchaeota archaeon]